MRKSARRRLSVSARSAPFVEDERHSCFHRGASTMTTKQPTIIYTLTDEAPLLATCSLLPIIRTFTAPAGIEVVDERHLGGGPHPGRVPRPPERGAAGARQPGRAGPPDAGCRTPTSSSCPTSARRCRSWSAAIKELQARGYKVPDYPGEPEDRRGEGDPRALLQGAGQRGEPGAARRQLRPPRAGWRSSATRARTRIRWASGARRRAPTSRT